MKKKIGKFLSVVIPIFIGVFLIIYQYNKFTDTQIAEMKSHFKTANYLYIYISLFIASLGLASRAYRWKFSIEQMGYQSSFYNNLMAVSAGYFMNLGVPRSGEVTRALILKKYSNIPFDKAFGTIVAERVVDSLIFLLFVVSAFLIEFDVLKDFILEKIPIKTIEIILAIGFIGFFTVLWFWKYSKWSFILALKLKMAGLVEGILSIVKMKNKWTFLFHSFFIWFSYLIMFYITIFALKETNQISFGAVIIAFVFGTFAIGFTNGGFGVFPILVGQIFVLYLVPVTAGNSLGWLIWTSQTLFTVFCGSLSFIFLPIYNRGRL